MSVWLDGKPFGGETLTAPLTVGELIERAKADLTDTGTLILGVRCDGEDVSPERLNEVLSQKVADFERLELISGRPVEIALDALNDTRRAFADTFARLKQASEDMASGKTAEGMAGFINCVGVWGNVHRAIVQGGALVGIDFERLVLRGRHVLEWLDELKSKLREIKEAIEARDHVLLGDILRYELNETLEGWENMLNAFSEHVAQLGNVTLLATPG